MSKLLTHMPVGLMAANVLPSSHIVTGPRPGTICSATSGDGGDEFVGGGGRPSVLKPGRGRTSIVARLISRPKRSPLVRKLSEESHRTLIEILKKSPWAQVADRQKLFDEKVAAVTVLGERRDVRAIPHLIKAMNSLEPGVSDAVAYALLRFGEHSVEPLIAAYEQLGRKEHALVVLCELGDERALNIVLDVLESFGLSHEQVTSIVAGMGASAVDPLVEKLHDNNPIVRARAVMCLGAIGDERAAVHLITAMKTDNFVREVAAEALGKVGGAQACDALIDVVQDERQPIKVILEAVKSLGRIHDPRVPRVLIGALDHPNDDVFEAAERALVAVGFDRAEEELARALRGDDEETSLAVIDVLGEMGGVATPTLVDALSDPRSEVRIKATDALSEIGDRRAAEPLSRLFADSDKPVVTVAILALMKLNYEFTPEQLVYMLGESNKDILAFARDKLQSVGEPAIGPLLAEVVDLDADARDEATKVLKERIPHRLVVPHLTEAWRGGDVAVRHGLMGVVWYIRGCEELMIEALNEGNVLVRESAARRLGGLGYKPAIEPLARLLGDASYDVRLTAAEALLKLGDSRGEQMLIERLQREFNAGQQLLIKRLPLAAADRLVVAYLERASSEEDLRSRVQKVQYAAQRTGLTQTLEKFITPVNQAIEAERRREEELHEQRDVINGKIREIATAIKDRLSEALGLKTTLSASTANGGGYGSVSMGMSMSMRMRQELRLEHRMELLPDNRLEIDEGETIEEAKERMRTLNFLVHHEMGHVVQKERGIPKPELRVNTYAHLDPKQAAHHANEMVIDKLAFAMARTHYVHGDGDVVFDEQVREIVSIHSYLALARIVLRNHRNERHELTDENLARMIAVTGEMATSTAVTPAVKKELKELAKAYQAIIVEGKDKAYRAEIAKLIRAYRRIFKSTSL